MTQWTFSRTWRTPTLPLSRSHDPAPTILDARFPFPLQVTPGTAAEHTQCYGPHHATSARTAHVVAHVWEEPRGCTCDLNTPRLEPKVLAPAGITLDRPQSIGCFFCKTARAIDMPRTDRRSWGIVLDVPMFLQLDVTPHRCLTCMHDGRPD